jgi:hypothetical protein
MASVSVVAVLLCGGPPGSVLVTWRGSRGIQLLRHALRRRTWPRVSRDVRRRCSEAVTRFGAHRVQYLLDCGK